ncbi:MAG: amino acid racemase, partial [Spirochaeta sp.]|nr:amino acid racemase [Spirochaeta sp.]
MTEGTDVAAETVGIIGGMSWESTVTYYQKLNRRYNARWGGHSSAPVIIHSVDFAAIEAMQRSGDWDGAAAILAEAAIGLERAGATVLLLATNTMHLVFDELVAATHVPWIHIADATGEALQRDGHTTVGLLGTRFTMEEQFYRGRLADRYGLNVLTPEATERREIDRIIFEELVHGTIREETRRYYRSVISAFADAGAEAVILGCTEIGLLFDADDASPDPGRPTASIHLYDTT